MLTSNERKQLAERFDVYDIVEALGLTAADLINAFDTQVEDCDELMQVLDD